MFSYFGTGIAEPGLNVNSANQIVGWGGLGWAGGGRVEDVGVHNMTLFSPFKPEFCTLLTLQIHL